MIRVLMVDDDPAVLDITKIFLERSGDMRVDAIESAKEAMEKLKDGHYDVIVSDYVMPEMDGISFLKQVRNQDSDVPFILFTGKGREEVVIEALNNGADYYLQKDTNPKVLYAELTHQIRQAAERQRTKRAVLESEEKYRALFENMNECFVLYEFVRDAQNEPVDYVIKDANPQIELIADVKPEDAIGKRATEIFRSEKAPFLEIYSKVGETGSPAKFEAYFPLTDRYFSISAFSIEKGQFATIFSDITEQKRMDEELRRAHKQLQDIIDFLPDATFVIDQDRKVIAWNRAVEEMTGVPKENVMEGGVYSYGEPFYGFKRPVLVDLIFSEDNSLKVQYDYVKRRGTALFAEVFVPTLYGGMGAYLWGTASPLFDDEGRIVGAIESIRDVTERKRAEKKLIQAHKQLLDIIDFLPDPTFVIDQDRKVIAWNRAIEEMTGVSKEEIVGKGDYAYGEVFYGAKRPILIDLIFSRDEELESLYHYVKREGDTLFAEAFVSPPRSGKGAYVWGTASPLFDKDKKIVGAIESIRDVTDIKETEMALQENEERLKLVIEGANLGIWDRNVVTGEVVRNRRLVEMFGYSEKDLTGTVWDCEKIIHPDDFGKVIAALRDHFEERTPYFEINYRLKRKDGRWIWVHDRGEVMTRDETGHPLRMAGITQDITEIRQYQEALKEANRKLNLLSSVTRHDILNQITGLSGYAQLLSEILPGDPAVQKYIDRVMELTETIRRQVIFTRDYQDMGVKAPEWQSVEEVVRWAAVSAPIEIAKNRFKLDISTGSLEIFADPMLEKVFFNLLENAVRHGQGVSEIRVSFIEKEDEDKGILVVEDDGSGIPAEMKAQIFDQAFGRHTGYGLFLSREILGITGMTITETGEEGKGARFEITVPKENYRKV